MEINITHTKYDKVDKDAIVFMHKNKPIKYRPWQNKVQQGRKRFTVVAVHRRAGKSVYACCELLSSALSKTGKYAYVSPLKRQSKDNVWDIMMDMLSKLIERSNAIKMYQPAANAFVQARAAEGIIRLYNGSSIYLLGNDDPHALRGMEFNGVVLDEVAQMDRETWFSVLRPTLASTKGWGLFIGTPNGIDLFSELYGFALSPQEKEWAAFTFPYTETDALPPNEVENMAREMGGKESNRFKREMLCDFNVTSVDQLLSLYDVKAAAERAPHMNRAPLLMGVDVAGFGDDRTVICLRKGPEVIKFFAYHELTLTEVAQNVNKIIFEYKDIKAVIIDATGYGAGLVDVLYREHCNVPIYDVNFSSRASESKYANRRAEMWFRLSAWIRSVGCIPNDFNLFNELCAPVYTMTEKGALQLERKADIKKRLGYSPDMADALALTFAEKIDEFSEQRSTIVRYAKRDKTTMFDRYERSMRLKDVYSYY